MINKEESKNGIIKIERPEIEMEFPEVILKIHQEYEAQLEAQYNA